MYPATWDKIASRNTKETLSFDYDRARMEALRALDAVAFPVQDSVRSERRAPDSVSCHEIVGAGSEATSATR